MIEDLAFKGCTALPVENNVRYADTYVVGGVDSTLTSYYIRDNTKWIGDFSFSNFNNLTNINIPNGVIKIGDNAFFGCDELNSIDIPETVTSIGVWGFYLCCKIKSITCHAINPPLCGNYCFLGIPYTTPIYVPSASVSLYQTADEWKNFYYIQAIATTLNQLTDSPADRFSKIITNSQLLILRDGKTYNAQGGEVK